MKSVPDGDDVLEPQDVESGKRSSSAKLLLTLVIILIVFSLIIYWIVEDVIIDGDIFPPSGVWGPTTVGPAEVTVEFGYMTPRQEPIDLSLVLIRNDTTWGRYAFTSNTDGALTLFNGENVGTLTYTDFADNEMVDIGDWVTLTELAPDSNYELIMVWVTNGSRITSTTFTTPSG